jgi:Sel1 repeat
MTSYFFIKNKYKMKKIIASALLLFMSISLHAQTEIGGFTIVTQAQKEEIIVDKELKNFAILCDFLAKYSNTGIEENNIIFSLDDEKFLAIFQYNNFQVSVHHHLPNYKYGSSSFLLQSKTTNVKNLPIYEELSKVAGKASTQGGTYFFNYSKSIFENNQIKEIVNGYSNPTFIGANALLFKRKELNLKSTPKALYENGEKFYRGNGQIKNFSTAFKYFKSAADSGYVEAYTMISNLYRDGDKYFSKNIEEAINYAQKALNLGSLPAFGSIGIIYQYHKNDLQTALKYFDEGSNKGDLSSLGGLYYMYKTGNAIVSKNKTKAKELAEKACIVSQKLETPTNYWCNELKQF